MTSIQSTPIQSAFHEQLRTVGAALRREAAMLAIVGVAFMAFAVIYAQQTGQALDYTPKVAVLTAGAGLLIAFAVWRGEELFGVAHLWTLPVGRSRHALAKAAAGWFWLMPATGAIVLALVLIAVLTGGELVGYSTRQVLIDQRLETLSWSDPAWLWIMPFTAATIGYLAGSALAVGLERRAWWLAAGLLAIGMLSVFGELEDVTRTLFMRQLGLDYVLTGSSDVFLTDKVGPGDDLAQVWGGVPTFGRWAAATAAWTAAGLAAVWIAVLRHRER